MRKRHHVSSELNGFKTNLRQICDWNEHLQQLEQLVEMILHWVPDGAVALL